MINQKESLQQRLLLRKNNKKKKNNRYDDEKSEISMSLISSKQHETPITNLESPGIIKRDFKKLPQDKIRIEPKSG